MPLDTTAIQRFMELINRSAMARARDVRIDLTEAILVTTEITALLSRVAMAQQASVTQSPANAADGGSFR